MTADPIWSQRCDRRPTGSGVLNGLRFAVKDLIAVAGAVRGCGNPHWAALQVPSPADAPCVAALRGAGAVCSGTTWLDEFAFGLSGENPWAGTPPNPIAPGHIPGGSSSGSAVAVAAGAVDLALGTDTAGSIRVPASWCGIWGMRPSHGAISAEGVRPLAPSLDVVGLFAADQRVLQRAMAVLLPPASQPLRLPPRRLLRIPELWALAEPAAIRALQHQARQLGQRLDLELEDLELEQLGVRDSNELLAILQAIQWAEVEANLADLPADLPLGPSLRRNRELVAGRDRQLLSPAQQKRRSLRRALAEQLGDDTLLLLPCTSGGAPRCGELGPDRSRSSVLRGVLGLGALAGLAGLPQLSVPGAFVAGPSGPLPVGLGVLAGAGLDRMLLELPLGSAP